MWYDAPRRFFYGTACCTTLEKPSSRNKARPQALAATTRLHKNGGYRTHTSQSRGALREARGLRRSTTSVMGCGFSGGEGLMSLASPTASRPWK